MNDISLTDLPDLEAKVGRMVKAFLENPLEGVDLHSQIAREIFGEPFTPDDRTLVKNLAFRALYGGAQPPLLCHDIPDVLRR